LKSLHVTYLSQPTAPWLQDPRAPYIALVLEVNRKVHEVEPDVEDTRFHGRLRIQPVDAGFGPPIGCHHPIIFSGFYTSNRVFTHQKSHKTLGKLPQSFFRNPALNSIHLETRGKKNTSKVKVDEKQLPSLVEVIIKEKQLDAILGHLPKPHGSWYVSLRLSL